QVAVGMRHKLVGFLGSRVKADGIIYPVIFRERHLTIFTVYLRTGGVYQMPYTMVTAALQYIHKTHQATVYICHRVLYAVPYPRLCGKVDNGIKFLLCK